MSANHDLPPAYLPAPPPPPPHPAGHYPPPHPAGHYPPPPGYPPNRGYPGYSPAGYPYPAPPPRAPMSGTRIADIVATVLLCMLQLGLSALVGFWSLFFPMAMDSCSYSHSSGRTCSDALMAAAYATTWGGIGAAALLALTGVVIGATKRRVMFVWPLLGTIILVVAAEAGVHFANAAGGL